LWIKTIFLFIERFCGIKRGFLEGFRGRAFAHVPFFVMGEPELVLLLPDSFFCPLFLPYVDILSQYEGRGLSFLCYYTERRTRRFYVRIFSVAGWSAQNERGDIIRLTCQEILPPRIDSLPSLRNPPSMNNSPEFKCCPSNLTYLFFIP
jgi:hypothetical protein